MAQVVIVEKSGLILFVKKYGHPRYMFWKKYFYTTPWKAQALELGTLESDGLKVNLELRLNSKNVFIIDHQIRGNCDIALSLYKYYIVVRATKYLHKTRYYSYDKEFYSKKFHRRMSKPVFAKDINKAEFFKSRRYADEVATRCRQTGSEMVAVREVYVYRENELLQKNIVVVLRHKENEKMKPQFIRTYDKADGGFTKTSRCDQAIRFTYDEYLDLYEQFQALHKDYFILPKIIDDGKPWSGKAKDVDGKEQVEGTLKLSNRK